MPNPKIPLEPDKFYHVYNRGINSCEIFREESNYEHFLRLYEKYIDPISSTYAWCLMGNHFHLLARIKEEGILQNLHPEGFQNLQGVIRYINQQFSNLFNAYTKAYNKRFNRTGSLFEHTFRRKEITSETYLKQLIIYIHNNPVHHGFFEHAMEYPWSSYLTCVSVKPTKLQRDAVVGWFDDRANFKFMHKQAENIEIEW